MNLPAAVMGATHTTYGRNSYARVRNTSRVAGLVFPTRASSGFGTFPGLKQSSAIRSRRHVGLPRLCLLLLTLGRHETRGKKRALRRGLGRDLRHPESPFQISSKSKENDKSTNQHHAYHQVPHILPTCSVNRGVIPSRTLIFCNGFAKG